MSYGTTTATQRPAGVTVIVFLNAFFTIIGYFFALAGMFFGISSVPIDAEGGLILIGVFLIVTIIIILYLILLYGVFKMNKIAYYIFMILLTLSVLSALLSLNIISLFIQGAMLIYLAIVANKFN